MRAILALAGVVLLLGAIGTKAADNGVSHDASLRLMMGTGQGSSFEGTFPHGANDQDYRFRACHSPDGKIVAQAQYSTQAYLADGTWLVDNAGAICVKWNQSGWINACNMPIPTTDGQFAMTGETTHTSVGNGKFLPPKSFDFCH